MKQQSTSKKSAVCGLPPPLRLRRTCRFAVCPRAGFTLLELMTVMVIMFILMGTSTLALRGIIRGAGISGAVANVRSVLTQGRQQAILKQQPTAVILDQDGDVYSMQVVMSFGTVDQANPSGIQGFSTVMDLPWTADQLAGSPVYNFDGEQGELGVMGGQGESTTAFATSGDISWSAGDQIALAAGNAVKLPPGMAFDPGASFPVVVQFLPDGSSPGGLTLDMVELNAAGSSPLTIEVQSTGLIEIGQPGE